MDTPEIAQLQNEIARLNRIIDVLVESNEALKRAIAVAEKGNGSETHSLAIAEKGNGSDTRSLAVAEKGNGSDTRSLAVVEKGNGPDTHSLAVAEKGNGPDTYSLAVAEKGNGPYTRSLAVAEKGNDPHNLPSSLPATIELTPGNLSRLYIYLLKQNFGKVRRSSLRNAAALMLHFYNGNRGDYPTLKKLTGLSQDGLGKYLRSLKKRGLIERNGWQQFKLTPHALHYLKQAGF